MYNCKSNLTQLKSIIKIGVILALSFGLHLNNHKANAQIDTLFNNVSNYLLSRDQDTTYISNYGNKFAIRLVSKNKFNFFKVRDRLNSSLVKYRPARDLSLGIGYTHKYFSFDLSFSLGLNKNSEFENPRAFDFQGKMFSTRHFISGTIQYYWGYKLTNIEGLVDKKGKIETVREDIRTVNFGLQYLHAFNYTKFSLKAPFVFSEVQKKSAGSIIGGASFAFFTMDADSSVVPPEFSGVFFPEANLVDVTSVNLAISVGYMYSFIYRSHFFLTVSLVPGVNVNGGDFRAEGLEREFVVPNIRFKIFTMNAMGYNGKRFFVGVNFLLETENTRLVKKLDLDVGSGMGSFFIGYRFGQK